MGQQINNGMIGSVVIRGLSSIILVVCSGITQAASDTDIERSLAEITVKARLIFKEEFTNLGNWKNLAPDTVWKIENGELQGAWAPGGSAIWLNREFAGNLLIVAEGRVLPPDPRMSRNVNQEGGKNFNIRLHVRGPNDTDILDTYRELLEQGTGPNGIGDDQYRGYLFTWTGAHTRLRRSPGYVNVSENKSYLPRLNTNHTIEILFVDGRLLYSVDGRVLHDYTDTAPFTRGKVAILTWNSIIVISGFEVYQVVDHFN